MTIKHNRHYQVTDPQFYGPVIDGKVDIQKLDFFQAGDHLNGFDQNGNNELLHALDQRSTNLKVSTNYVLPDQIKKLYPNLTFTNWIGPIMTYLDFCKQPLVLPTNREFSNFVCSFNASDCYARQFLTSALHKFGWFNPEYSSKMFVVSKDTIDGNLASYVNHDQERFYRKFIIDDNADEFYQSSIEFGYDKLNNLGNLTHLQEKITSSFVQIVSETVGHSYVPYLTEKLIYPIVCKTLWVGYAQPGWHAYVKKMCGFKQYDKIFDYSFDNIQNPVIRLVEMLTMLSKFENLSKLDWHDLYLIEKDTIDFNYDHYFSRSYLTNMSIE
jgi:hypothetical protein